MKNKETLQGMEKKLAGRVLKGFEGFGITGFIIGGKKVSKEGKKIIIEKVKR